MFVDRIRIMARAGKGGRGCVSFLRELHKPNGGPNGGDGGKGGSVILEVDHHLNNLAHIGYVPHQYAKNGENGQHKQMSGRNAPDLVLKVPPGTIISRLEVPPDSPEPEFDEFGAPLVPSSQRLLPIPTSGPSSKSSPTWSSPGSASSSARAATAGAATAISSRRSTRPPAVTKRAGPARTANISSS